MNKRMFVSVVGMVVLVAGAVGLVSLAWFYPPAHLHAEPPSRFTVEKVGDTSGYCILNLITDSRTGRQYLSVYHGGMIEVNLAPAMVTVDPIQR